MTSVLVIDDSATIRKLVEMSLRGSPFAPHFCASAADGIAEARRLRPSVILLDCVLPDSSGQQVCRQLAADERTRAIPILLVSAKAEAVRAEFRDSPSVVDFVAKPFTGPDLVRRIRRALGQRTSRFDREQQERAAHVLYTHLRDGLALLPALAKQIGTSPPGPYLAKRLLTPEAVGAILEDLAELYEAAPDAAPAMSATAILDRAPGFSARVRDARLDAHARRVLTLVNGRHTLADIARRAGLELRAVADQARALVETGLLEDRGAVPTRDRARPVVILEPDVQGFQQPLASLLEARREAPELVPVAHVAEVVSVVRRVHPCLVVVNATSEPQGVGDAARELRADSALSDVALVAVLDRFVQTDRDNLYSAGFDAVLSKPIIVGDLERYIEKKENPWIRS